MNLSGVGLDQALGASSGHTTVREARQDFDQLVQSLQAGNLSAAQQAFSSFQQVQAGLTNAAPTQASNATATTATNPVLSDWSSLGQALQSGNLSSAQGALGKLQQDARSMWQSHLEQEKQNAQSIFALMQGAQQGVSATAGSPAVSAPTTAASVADDLKALDQSLQTGDTTSAQKLLAKLEQDLQASGQTASQEPGQKHGGHHHHHHGGFAGNQSVASSYASAIPAQATTTANSGGTDTTV